jgi:hypothetical protein
MPIIVALVVLVAVLYGAFWSFNALAASFGEGVAIGAAVVVIAIVVALVAWWWRRRQEVAPNTHDGDWTHELKRDWGGVRLASEKRLCEVRVRNPAADKQGSKHGYEEGQYIFADLKSALARPDPSDSSAWQVVLDVKDDKHSQWLLPIRDKSDARKWGRILSKAVAQTL